LDRIWEFLPSTISFCLFRNHVGILNCVGFWMIVTIRSSSSELRSPALWDCISKCMYHEIYRTHRLLRSTSAFLQTKLEYRRPTPLISVKAYMILRFPSTFVLRRRRMCYNLPNDQILIILGRNATLRTWNCWWASGRTRDILRDR
jgi:hypothetical protein